MTKLGDYGWGVRDDITTEQANAWGYEPTVKIERLDGKKYRLWWSSRYGGMWLAEEASA